MFTEIALLAALLFVMMFVRAYRIDADPPPRLSDSIGIYTDPPMYTASARAGALGHETVGADEKAFEYTAVSGVARLVFAVFGTGLRQHAAVALLFSIMTLLAAYLVLRKVGGVVTGVFFLLLMVLNYDQLFMSRLPFLEHAMVLAAFSSMAILLYYPAPRGWAVAGMVFAVGILFGKLHGLIFLAPFALILLPAGSAPGAPGKNRRPAVVFVAGAAILGAVWLAAVYFPARAVVGGYFRDVFSLYGDAMGLSSIPAFVAAYLGFGGNSISLQYGLLPAAAAAAFIVRLIWDLARGTAGSEEAARTGARLWIAMGIIAFYGALMIWEYQPARYKLAIVYLLNFAAAHELALWWKEPLAQRRRAPTTARAAILAGLAAAVVAAPIFFRLLLLLLTDREHSWGLAGLAAGLSMLVGLAVVAGLRRSPQPLMALARIRRPAAIAVVVLTIATAWPFYGEFLSAPTFSLRDSNRDLSSIVGPGALVSGPFAAALTVDNELQSAIRMFGSERLDPEYFKRNPVTHLSVDLANEQEIAAEYPEIAGRASLLTSYHIGLRPVRVYLVHDIAGNDHAGRYSPTLFEEGIRAFLRGDEDRWRSSLQRFLQQRPDNMSAHRFVAEQADRAGDFQSAIAEYKNAIEFAPTNYHLNLSLCNAYRRAFEKTGNPEYRSSSESYFQQALKYAPLIAEKVSKQ